MLLDYYTHIFRVFSKTAKSEMVKIIIALINCILLNNKPLEFSFIPNDTTYFQLIAHPFTILFTA